ncbi:hypothetical protein KSS87_006995 [Heliosperma pusillum]|nr:hypothetical protein KSS87_006995 [Heliosperma pusillum]
MVVRWQFGSGVSGAFEVDFEFKIFGVAREVSGAFGGRLQVSDLGIGREMSGGCGVRIGGPDEACGGCGGRWTVVMSVVNDWEVVKEAEMPK